MITFSQFGKHGRLGNQLFQYAAIIGMSDKYGHQYSFPEEWIYAKYFSSIVSFPILSHDIEKGRKVKFEEPKFHYMPELFDDLFVNKTNDWLIDLHGYFQTEKYWQDSKYHVKQALQFRSEFIDSIPEDFQKLYEKETIAISIRRGDFVDNPNYAQLPINYYIAALTTYFPDWQDFNLMIFSDDPEYCRVHFGCCPNAFIIENNYREDQEKNPAFNDSDSAIEQLLLMSKCDHFILANSTFSWWGAYLGEKEHSIIIRPAHHFDGNLKRDLDAKDHYPDHWRSFDHLTETGEIKTIDLQDITFMIPVFKDSVDRIENLELNLCLLQRWFKTNIMVMEQGGQAFEYLDKFIDYYPIADKKFHRTRMLNTMTSWAKTEFVANWDADVIIPPMQILVSVMMLRDGIDVVYPYNGLFARVPRDQWYKRIAKCFDPGIFGNTPFKGTNSIEDLPSVGGAIFFNKEKFIDGGMENENFISYGPEDAERFERFTKLGFVVKRTDGKLFHVDHWNGVNSSTRNPYIENNRAEWHKIKAMTREELIAYVKTWEWSKRK